MPYLVGILLSFLVTVLTSLAVGIVSYTVVLPNLMTLVQSYFTTLPPQILQTLGYFKLDVFISLVLSGASAGLTGKMSFTKK